MPEEFFWKFWILINVEFLLVTENEATPMEYSFYDFFIALKIIQNSNSKFSSINYFFQHLLFVNFLCSYNWGQLVA